jgi:hypothetical protein
VATVVTAGKGQKQSNNFKVVHFITGNVTNPASLSITANKVFVCRGTSVDIVVSDSTGVARNSRKTSGMSCTSAGCTIDNVVKTQRYTSVSADGKDKDGIQIVPTDG